MELEVEKVVTKVLRDQEQILKEQSGISMSAPSDDHDLNFMCMMMEEVKRNKK